MARKSTYDERVFERHTVKVVRRMNTADYIVCVDKPKWASAVASVAILSLTDDLAVGLVTMRDSALYPVDTVNSKDSLVSAKLSARKLTPVTPTSPQRSIGCGISNASLGHFDYRRDMTAQDRILGDTGLVTFYFYDKVLFRRFDTCLATRIHNGLCSSIVNQVDGWQLSHVDDGLVKAINSYYPITDRNETYRDQFVAAVKFLQELLPRIITNARVEAQVGRRHVIGGRGMLRGEEI